MQLFYLFALEILYQFVFFFFFFALIFSPPHWLNVLFSKLSSLQCLWPGLSLERNMLEQAALTLPFWGMCAHRIPASSSFHMHSALEADPAACPAQPQGSVLEREGKGGKGSGLLCVALLSCGAWRGCRITKSPLLWASKPPYTPLQGCQPTALPAGTRALAAGPRSTELQFTHICLSPIICKEERSWNSWSNLDQFLNDYS